MWNKWKNLEILEKEGFNIPDFLILKIWDDFNEKIKNLDKSKKYAIRSNMWVEDSENSSFAWQFQTFVNVEFNEIIEKINLVIDDAKSPHLTSPNGRGKKWLKNHQISVIVQEYIKFEYSWIAFTRSPNWSYEINIEYHKWIWEDIVSGKVIPKTIKLYHWEKISNNKQKKVRELCWKEVFQKFIGNIKKIEKIFNFPQDIEWGSANWKIYFLQSRNITTISQEKWKEIKYIDEFIEKEEKSCYLSPFGRDWERAFFYEKNEISEILPKVTNFSYDLIKKVYAKNWPVYNFYTKNWLKIETNNFLKIIWNEIFVDKQIELQNFFPNFTLFKNKYKKKFIFNSKIFITLNNFIKLNFIKFNKNNILEKIEKQINNFKNELTNKNSPIIPQGTFSWPSGSIHLVPFHKGDENTFLKNYETIFEINFFTQKYFASIDIFQKKLKINILDFLDSKLVEKDDLVKIKNILNKIDYSKIIWNSFDIEDNSKFSTNIFDKTKKEIPEKFYKLPLWKQNFIKQKIIDLQFFSDLREIWRVLTVLNINILRKNNSPIIPFNKGDEEQNYIFENKISDTFIEEEKNKINILSNYDAKWKLVEVDYLEKNYDKTKKYILFTKNLNPNLVQYFDKIEWIISEKWWILSHLSIMCREYQKSLIVLNLKENNINLWDEIIFKDWEVRKYLT